MTAAPSRAPQNERGTEETSPEISAQVLAEQLASLYGLSRAPTVLGWIFCLIPLVGLWPHLPHVVLAGWFAARSLIVALRCVDAWQFRRAKPTAAEAPVWLRRYLLLLGADALSWGAMGWFFHTPTMPDLEGVMLASVVGLGATGVFSLGSMWRANLLFSGLAFTPLAIYHLGLGTPAGVFAATGLLLFLVIALIESRRIEARTTEQLRQRFAQAWVAEQRQQALQTAEHSSTSKSRFVAVMSHEIRTPLNGILGMTQLLERSSLDAQQREQLDIVRRSGRHLLALVNDILDLARIESGKLAVDSGPVQITEAVDDVCRLLGETARDKGLAFGLKLAPALPAYVLGDCSRIKQVLHNLIGNAIKFTERGSVEVDVSTVLDMRAGTLLRFAVRDTGEGIAADQMERVFAPFEQASIADRPRDHAGTGLGLTISRELARAMGGDLRCSSAPGQGSLFEFTLPLQVCTELPQRAAPAPADRPRPQQLQGRVLLVDDSPVNVLVAASMLERCGLQVDQAEHGLQALQRMEENDYDLVLMDCQMPQLDGFEATRRWRSHERRHLLGHVPIVALTASAVNGDRERCIRCGMDDYLVKPFEMDDLVDVVQRNLQHQPVPALS
jgi:signal transduction histidine kinase/CheY-like chemotaxis protein